MIKTDGKPTVAWGKLPAQPRPKSKRRGPVWHCSQCRAFHPCDKHAQA